MKKYILILGAIICGIGPLSGYDEVIMNDQEMRRNNIRLINVSENNDIAQGMIFSALIDFDDQTSVAQSSSFTTVVVRVYKREGEYVKKGDLICELASDDLSNLYFEYKTTKERFDIVRQNAKKDEELYKKGVISKREYQNSYFMMKESEFKLDEARSKLDLLGVNITAINENQTGFPIIAKASGLLSFAPRQSGQKIDAFSPYIRITFPNSKMLGRIRIPSHLAGAIEKGDEVLDENGETIGYIETISVTLDKATNTILGIANISAKKYKVGELVNVRIGGKLPEGSVFIPSSSIVKVGNDYVVFIRTNQGFKPTKVAITEEREGGFGVKNIFSKKDRLANGRVIILQGMLSGLGVGANAR